MAIAPPHDGSVLGIRRLAPAGRSHDDPAHPRRHVDWVLIVVTLALLGIGLVAVYSSRRDALIAANLSQYFYVRKQLLFGILGIGALLAVISIDYRRLREWALWGYLLALGLLLAVVAVGTRTKGAQAWFQLGPYKLEPSELAKIAVIVALAAYASNHRGNLERAHLVTLLALVGFPAALVMLQPDLGTTLVFVTIAAAVIVTAGAHRRDIGVLTLCALVTIVGVLNTNVVRDYQRARLGAFIDQSDAAVQRCFQQNAQVCPAYHLEQSKLAIANGRLTGTGLFNGTQTKLQYVSEQQTDFIFTVVAEEFGFVGGAIVLGLYALMSLRIWRIARLSKDLFGTLICAGALGLVVFQVFENIGMTMGIMPITGIPLPLLSYGGSSVISFLVLIGLVENVHMRRFQ